MTLLNNPYDLIQHIHIQNVHNQHRTFQCTLHVGSKNVDYFNSTNTNPQSELNHLGNNWWTGKRMGLSLNFIKEPKLVLSRWNTSPNTKHWIPFTYEQWTNISMQSTYICIYIRCESNHIWLSCFAVQIVLLVPYILEFSDRKHRAPENWQLMWHFSFLTQYWRNHFCVNFHLYSSGMQKIW